MELVQSRIVTDDVEGLERSMPGWRGLRWRSTSTTSRSRPGRMAVGFSKSHFTEYGKTWPSGLRVGSAGTRPSSTGCKGHPSLK
jgi:hypothetical protein